MRIHPLRPSSRSVWALAACALLLCVTLAGCASSAPTSDASGSTPGSTPGSGSHAATPTHAPVTPPPPRALAWFQQDSHQVGQIWASVNGGAAHQVTHMPPSTADCRYDEHWSPPVFSPDLSKIVAAWGSNDCTDGPEVGPIYIINAATGAASKVPSSSIRLSLRQTGWINNSAIWWLAPDGQHVNRYAVGDASSSAIGPLGGYAQDAVLRGNTLFFERYVSGSTFTYSLKRFDMSSHTVLAGSINLGSASLCQCSRGDMLAPGFDAARDGSHIVYQVITPAADPNNHPEGVGSSQFFYANADGSGASRIARVATAASFVKMQMSPNGQLVAVARAEPAPSVFTASVTSPGASGDPNMHFYTPDSTSYPVWKYDNATFWASTDHPDMEHFDLGVGAGSVGAAGGSNPWYTIGS